MRIPGLPLVLSLLLATSAAAHDGGHGGDAPSVPASASVGDVDFANSGAPAAQSAFRLGLAQLHNFEYAAAIEAFRQAQAADPDFAMAYWGEALAYTHPIWMEQDIDAARAALARLGPTPEARAAKAPTAREKAWLATVEVLYGEGSKEERDRLYSAAMGELSARYPDDVDARAFHGLSILGLAHEGRDTAIYMRAAAVLEEAFLENRRHPGVLHYLIHSYDDPDHAPLGLRAARLYADVAGEAGHAVHMTSHIFLALGLWDDTAAMNERAQGVVNRQRAARGQPPSSCGHYAEWLVYAELQRGRTAEADAVIDGCLVEARSGLAAQGPGPGARAVRSWSDMALRRLIETGDWPDERLQAPARGFPETRLHLAYGDVLAARDAAGAAAAHTRLQSVAEDLRRIGRPGTAEARYTERRLEVLLAQSAGLAALRAGKAEEGVSELRRAVELEVALPVEFGPPAIEKPGYELLAEELARLGRADEAARAWSAALARAPGRRLSAQGLSGR